MESRWVAYHGRRGSEGFAVGARDGDGIGGGGGTRMTRAAVAGVEVSTVGDSPTRAGWEGGERGCTQAVAAEAGQRPADKLVPPDRKWAPDSPTLCKH